MASTLGHGNHIECETVFFLFLSTFDGLTAVQILADLEQDFLGNDVKDF